MSTRCAAAGVESFGEQWDRKDEATEQVTSDDRAAALVVCEDPPDLLRAAVGGRLDAGALRNPDSPHTAHPQPLGLDVFRSPLHRSGRGGSLDRSGGFQTR